MEIVTMTSLMDESAYATLPIASLQSRIYQHWWCNYKNQLLTHVCDQGQEISPPDVDSDEGNWLIGLKSQGMLCSV